MSQQFVILGGGVIGLSIGYELSTRGHRVTLIDTNGFASKASWAGAGMLPPSNRATAVHPYEHLEALSNQVHREWASRLLRETEIDNGYRDCGSLYLARSAGEIASLVGAIHEWDDRQIINQQLDDKALQQRFPLLANVLSGSSIGKAVFVPAAAQFHNPRHAQALLAACKKNGVRLLANRQDIQVHVARQQIESVQAGGETISGDQFVFAAGPWTEGLLGQFNVALPMQPVRGQLALYRLNENAAAGWIDAPMVNEGSRYLVPRSDGHVLAGATIEEVGFDCQTTAAEVADLRAWAESFTDELGPENYLKAWAGLRPGTYDGFPYLGRLAEFDNAIIATGHFKAGLQTSTGTAQVIADLAEQKTPEIELAPFSPNRVGPAKKNE